MSTHSPEPARTVAETLAGLLTLATRAGVRVRPTQRPNGYEIDYGYAQWLVTFSVRRQEDGSWAVE